MAAPTLAGVTTLATANALSVTSPAFTPAVGTLLVAKVSQEDNHNAQTVTSSPALTWTKQAEMTLTSNSRVAVWTATVASAVSTTVTVTKAGGSRRQSIVVERWSDGVLDATPAIIQASGTGAPSATITTEAANSVVSWVCADWNAVSGASRAYRSSATEEGYDFQTGIYTAYYARQATTTAGSQTAGLTAPTGQAWQMAGIEVQGPAAPPPNSGAGSGTVPMTGTAVGSAGHAGSGSGTVPMTGTAAGSIDTAGAGSGTVSYAGTADGNSPDGLMEGAGSGTVSLTGAADGYILTGGAGSGTVSTTGTANGQAPAITAPDAPTGLTVTGVTSTTVSLSWTDNSDNESGFRVEWVVVPAGGQPTAPLTVTSITADASADVSWYAPVSEGDSAITHYVITPYDGATPLTATEVPVGSVESYADSYGGTALRATVTGLTNATPYTFTVKARNAQGDSEESVASGENTPFANLVFGDDFNGPAGAAPDPEWWVYDRCGYLLQNEVQWYKPEFCVLDGNGNLKITADQISTQGPRYPSDPQYPGTITQPWRSGACQSNTRLFYPSAGNKMIYEARFQLNTNAGNGYWPGFFWLEGQLYLDAWKTDPLQEGWNSTDKAEIDVAEWYGTGQPSSYGNVSWDGGMEKTDINGVSGLDTSMHTFTCEWTPGVSCVFKRDGATTATHTGNVPAQGAQFFLMLYMQMLAGAPSPPQSIYTDWVRVYEVPV